MHLYQFTYLQKLGKKKHTFTLNKYINKYVCNTVTDINMININTDFYIFNI